MRKEGCMHMSDFFIALKRSYLSLEGNQVRVFHPAIKFDDEKEYTFFPDEGSLSGLIEFYNEREALSYAKRLYNHYCERTNNPSI